VQIPARYSGNRYFVCTDLVPRSARIARAPGIASCKLLQDRVSPLRPLFQGVPGELGRSPHNPMLESPLISELAGDLH